MRSSFLENIYDVERFCFWYHTEPSDKGHWQYFWPNLFDWKFCLPSKNFWQKRHPCIRGKFIFINWFISKNSKIIKVWFTVRNIIYVLTVSQVTVTPCYYFLQSDLTFAPKKCSLPKLVSALSALLSCITNQERGRYMRLMPSPLVTHSENWFDHLKPPQGHTQKAVHSVWVRWAELKQPLKGGAWNVPDVGRTFGQGFWHLLDSLPASPLDSEAQQQNFCRSFRIT